MHTLVDECTCEALKPFFSHTATFLMSLQLSACPQVSSVVSGVGFIISEPSDFSSGSGSGVSTGSGSDSGSDSGSSGVSSTSSSAVKLAALIRGFVKINNKLIYWVSDAHSP